MFFHEAHFAPTAGPFPVGSEIISPYYLASSNSKKKLKHYYDEYEGYKEPDESIHIGHDLTPLCCGWFRVHRRWLGLLRALVTSYGTAPPALKRHR